MTNDRNDIERVLDGIKSAKEWYDNNRDLFEKFAGDNSGIDLTDTGPMTEAEVHDDKVIVVADIPGAAPTDMHVKFYENSITCTIDGEKFTAQVPSDVDEDSLDATMKNGVIRVELDRENSTADDVSVDSITRVDDTIGDDQESDRSDEGPKSDGDSLSDLIDDSDDSDSSGTEGGE